MSTTHDPENTPAPPLRGLFYAQFDNKIGPKFLHVVPERLLSDSETEFVTSYFFPKPELCGSLLTIGGISRLKITGCPLYIDHARYERHRFTFCFGMIFGQDDDVGPYGPVLKKMSFFFHKLEDESQFLSQGAGGKLGPLLARIREDLYDRGECIVRVLDVKTSLALKLFPKPLDPPNIGDFQVPVLTRNLKNMILKDWDLTIQRLEQHIDGKKFVKRIAIESGMDLTIVRTALQQLLYYRVIVMLDVFQYSNLYSCTRHISRLAENDTLQTECRNQIFKDSSRNELSFSKIFQLYASIHPSVPFGEFCIENNTELLGIDEQRFITFGLRVGILRRVRHVPVPQVYSLPTLSPIGVKVGDTQSATIRALIDGSNGLDDLCGITTIPSAEVKMILDSMNDVAIVKM